MKVFFNLLFFVFFLENCDAMLKEYIVNDVNVGFNIKSRVISLQSDECVKRLDATDCVSSDVQDFVVSIPACTMFSLLVNDSLVSEQMTELLTSLNTDKFKINPSMDFILGDDSIASFDRSFVALCFSLSKILLCCTVQQVGVITEHLELCLGTATQNAYASCFEFSHKSEQEISKIELYFNNVSNKLESLIKEIRKLCKQSMH